MKTPYTLITGASGGIGKELAAQAASEGHNLVLVARDADALQAVASDLSYRYAIDAVVITCDLTKTDAARKVFEQTSAKRIVVDILINNAGFGDYGAFSGTDTTKELSMIDLNVRALTELTHLYLPDMVGKKHGYIMNVGSIASFFPGPYMAVYFASKAYVLSFSEALAEELVGTGVSVTCLCPGSTKTNFGSSAHVKASHSTITTKVTAAQVAAFGWRSMKQGKVIAIHGTGNKLLVQLTRITSRRFITRAVGRMQK